MSSEPGLELGPTIRDREVSQMVPLEVGAQFLLVMAAGTFGLLTRVPYCATLTVEEASAGLSPSGASGARLK